MKILHIGPDSQFMKFVSETFEFAAPNSNKYIIIGSSANLKNPLIGGDVEILPFGSASILRLSKLLRGVDAVVAHGLYIQSILAFLLVPRRVVRVWSGWGFDYYGITPSQKRDLYEAKTYEALCGLENQEQKKTIIAILVSLCGRYLRRKAVGQVDFFSAPIPNDYDEMLRAFPNFNGDYSQINYGDVGSTFSLGNSLSGSSNILVGNSASFSSNHIEVFNILARKNISGRKVIVPLSYGDAGCKEMVIKSGEEILGENFCPLTGFMPLLEYLSIVASCNVVIMNHRRQQALGNIGSALYNGAHVYLNSSSSVYDFFKERGAVVSSIDELSHGEIPIIGLAENDVIKNKAVLEEFWGADVVRSNVEELIARMRGRGNCSR